MRLIVDIGHPAHVHYFRNMLVDARALGHEYLVVARERDEIHGLLRSYDIPFVSRGTGSSGGLGRAIYTLRTDAAMLQHAFRFKPDLFLSFGSPYAAHAAALYRRPHVAFDDTDAPHLAQRLYRPFTDVVVTPEWFRQDLGRRQIRFPGVMEMSYLHPGRFQPDPGIWRALKLDPGEPFAILRFNRFKAIHDTNVSGFSASGRQRLLDALLPYGRVFVSAEGSMPDEFVPYRLPTSVETIHDVLAAAHVYVGESGTMTTEAACVGTPAVRCHSFAGTSLERGNFIALEEKFNLVRSFNPRDEDAAIECAVAHMRAGSLRRESRLAPFLREAVDVTALMLWLVTEYPRSVHELRSKPHLMDQFA